MSVYSLENDLQNVNVLAFLEMIGEAEGADYDTMVGGRSFSDFSRHPAVYNASLNSTAAGKYQFLLRTWNDEQSRLGLPDFSPHSQDLAALDLIAQKNAIAPIKAGQIATAIHLVRKVWASFPGAGYGQHERSLQWMLNTYADELAGITNSGQVQVAGDDGQPLIDIGLVGSVDVKASDSAPGLSTALLVGAGLLAAYLILDR